MVSYRINPLQKKKNLTACLLFLCLVIQLYIWLVGYPKTWVQLLAGSLTLFPWTLSPLLSWLYSFLHGLVMHVNTMVISMVTVGWWSATVWTQPCVHIWIEGDGRTSLEIQRATEVRSSSVQGYGVMEDSLFRKDSGLKILASFPGSPLALGRAWEWGYEDPVENTKDLKFEFRV